MSLNHSLTEARSELSKIDKDFLSLEKDLKYVKKDSYQNGYYNLIQTISTTCNLANVFNTLDPIKKALNLIFGPVGFGLLTVANVSNFHEASQLLNELKKKQTELDNIKKKINDLAKEFQQILLVSA